MVSEEELKLKLKGKLGKTCPSKEDMPAEVKKCVLSMPNVVDYDADFVSFKQGNKTVKQKLGKAINKYCVSKPLIPTVKQSGEVQYDVNIPANEEAGKCLMNIEGIITVDLSRDIFARRTHETGYEKTSIKDAYNKYCSPKIIFERWTQSFKTCNDTLTAVKEALDRREKTNEQKVLEKLVGVYPTTDPNLEIVISQDPNDIVTKSTTRSWEDVSCERIGGMYGNPTEWLKGEGSCGFCSDIEHGNLVLFVRETYKLGGKEATEYLGRQMLRWCYTTDGKHGLGIENKWYGKHIHEKKVFDYRDQLLKELGKKTGVKVNYKGSCITPYTYNGYSDVERARKGGKYYGNTTITYRVSKIPQNLVDIVPDWGRSIFDNLGGTMWVYSRNTDGSFKGIEEIDIPEEFTNADQLIKVLEAIDYYEYHTYDFDDIKRDLISEWIHEGDTGNIYLLGEDDLENFIAENEDVEITEGAMKKIKTILEDSIVYFNSNVGTELEESDIGDAYEEIDIREIIVMDWGYNNELQRESDQAYYMTNERKQWEQQIEDAFENR